MKPKDIIVGRKYRHKQHPGVTYLGVGFRSGYIPDVYWRKELIIIGSKDNNGIGSIVTKPNQRSYPGVKGDTNVGAQYFWDGFVLIDENNP